MFMVYKRIVVDVHEKLVFKVPFVASVTIAKKERKKKKNKATKQSPRKFIILHLQFGLLIM